LALGAALLAIGSVAGGDLPAQPVKDTDAIVQVMRATWDKPDAALTVGPVVIEGDTAIAGWTQADMGGRALLRRKHGGPWAVVLCAGDQLRTTEALRMAGIAEATAQPLIEKLKTAEADLPPSRLALFSRFEGLVTMDAHGGHPH
jgi:hypothetical protein